MNYRHFGRCIPPACFAPPSFGTFENCACSVDFGTSRFVPSFPPVAPSWLCVAKELRAPKYHVHSGCRSLYSGRLGWATMRLGPFRLSRRITPDKRSARTGSSGRDTSHLILVSFPFPISRSEYPVEFNFISAPPSRPLITLRWSTHLAFRFLGLVFGARFYIFNTQLVISPTKPTSRHVNVWRQRRTVRYLFLKLDGQKVQMYVQRIPDLRPPTNSPVTRPIFFSRNCTFAAELYSEILTARRRAAGAIFRNSYPHGAAVWRPHFSYIRDISARYFICGCRVARTLWQQGDSSTIRADR